MADASDALGWIIATISIIVLLAIPIALMMWALPPIAAVLVFIFMGMLVLIGFAVLTRPD